MSHGQPQLPSSSMTFDGMSEDLLKDGWRVETKALGFSMVISRGSTLTSVCQSGQALQTHSSSARPTPYTHSVDPNASNQRRNQPVEKRFPLKGVKEAGQRLQKHALELGSLTKKLAFQGCLQMALLLKHRINVTNGH